MHENEKLVLGRISQAAIGGAFVGMVLVGTIVWWDVSSIRTLLSATEETLRLNLFLAGAMAKGALLGAALGSATPMRQRATGRSTVNRPLVGAAEA